MGTRDDEELKELFDNAESFDLSFFSNNTIAEFAKHFISTGTLHDARVLQMRLKRLLGNATFLQAFQHSGGLLSIRLARISVSKQYLCSDLSSPWACCPFGEGREHASLLFAAASSAMDMADHATPDKC